MTAQLAPTPIFKAWDNNGFPLALGFLTTYAAGTLTKIPSYVDSTQTTQNPNPRQLNFRGEMPLWLDPTLAYKIALTDVFGNIIPGYPVDNIQGAIGVASNIIPSITNTFTLGTPSITFANAYFGPNGAAVFDPVSGDIGYYARTAAEIAASVTPVSFSYAPGDIRRYGASLSASAAANTTAIQSAQSGNFGVIYAPPGTFAYTVASVTNCTAYGLNALSKNGTGGTPGNNNTAFGTQALAALSGGASNPTGSTAVGYLALAASNGATNTAIGDNCMSSDLTGTDNTAVGAQALFSETNSTGNNCFGFQSGYYITTGVSNLLLGNYAGGGISGPGPGVGLTTGSNNVGVGGGTLANLATGSNNTAIGLGALLNNIGGNSNVAVGFFAGTHANSSNEFYLDNQDRGNNATEIANAAIYGNFGAAAANNRLRFNAQLSASVGTLCSTNVAPTIASASVIAPTTAITFVSGTTTVTGITVPSWMNNGGRITLIPTGVWAWTTATNIALAGTSVVSKALDFIWDAGTSKWYPSYIA